MLHSRLLGHLLGLRYRLLWAQTRSRNGRIALFISAYLFGMMVFALLAFGGFGAALAGVKSGHAELVARIVLAAFFFNGLTASVILGFGMDSVFSGAALRRYPLSALDRLVARQLTAFFEPLWMIVLALYLGLAFGFYALGVCGFWLGLTAALFLIVVNYLLARVLLNLVERLMNTRWGAAVMLGVILCFSLLPGLLAPRLLHHRELLAPVEWVMQFTPPFTAAHAISGATAGAAALDLLALALWSAALLAAIFWFEHRPPTVRTVVRAKAQWDSAYDRIAAHFGPVYAPLAGKMLRYFMRSNRVRYNYVLAVPLMAFLTYSQSRRGGEAAVFAVALSAFALVGFIGTAVLAVNQFGYDGGGFRRWFLLPVAPETVFRASSLTTLAVSGSLLPPAFLLWFAVAPVHTTPVMAVMLMSSGVGGLLLFNALGLWTTLYSPRRSSFAQTFGNNLSMGGNILTIGGVMVFVLLPLLLRGAGRQELLLTHWWAFPLFLALAGGFYCFTLQAGAARFRTRRERLMAILEGRE